MQSGGQEADDKSGHWKEGKREDGEIERGGREGAGEKVRGNEGERGEDWGREMRKRKMIQDIKG